MPLNKPESYNDGKYLPYDIKLVIIEENCKGCPFLRLVGTMDEIEYGCVYPEDIRFINSNIREPYLTATEIVANTCDFWESRTKFQIVPIESEPEFNSDLPFSEDCGVRY